MDPARRFSKQVLSGIIAGSLLWWLIVPRILKAFYDRPEPTSCDSGWWGCEQNEFDRGFTEAAVFAPMATGLVSHVFTLVACPVVAVHAVWSESAPQVAKHDLVVYAAAQMVTAGASSIAKDGFQRQRPCYYYGRSNETEGYLIDKVSAQEWKSFWSGDTSSGWSFVVAAVVLLHLRSRTDAARKVAVRGGALATIGSLLRIAGFMHWLTDVLAGFVCGCLCGAGLPLLLWRACGGESAKVETSVTERVLQRESPLKTASETVP